MILKKISFSSEEFDTNSFATAKQLSEVLDDYESFKEKLFELYDIDPEKTQVIQVGNAKELLRSINSLDSQCEKIDIITHIKDVYLDKIIDVEKAIFTIYSIKDKFILNKLKSDSLVAETRYSAKSDILDYFDLNKFANYCNKSDYPDLIAVIKDYLKEKNIQNIDLWMLRLLYEYESKKFYIRAQVHPDYYKDYGINFSVVAILLALNKYVLNTKHEVFINNYHVDDSNIYVSFSFTRPIPINPNLTLSFNLILENDEVKRDAVSFNGLFKLTYKEKGKTKEIFLKPTGYKKDKNEYATDLLTYKHSVNIETVFSSLEKLPELINQFINQVSEDARIISNIKHPNEVKNLLLQKVHSARKEEFLKYRERVRNQLMQISVDSIFKLFTLLRDVEELFDNDDVVSVNYWRTKLYNVMVEKGKGDK